LKSKLQAFGIPSSIMPVSDSGEILCQQANMKWNERRLEERLRRLEPNDGSLPKYASAQPEAGVQASIGNLRKPCQSDQIGGLALVQAFRRIPSPVFEQVVQIPSNRDVLLGRGRLCQQHVVSLLPVFFQDPLSLLHPVIAQQREFVPGFGREISCSAS
jgi:hypothetical protein